MNMYATNRERIIHSRAEECIKNWKFDCLSCLVGVSLKDAHEHMLKHQIARHINFHEYEAMKIARICLEACKIALASERDVDGEKDDLGEDFFHVKQLKLAISMAKEVGLE